MSTKVIRRIHKLRKHAENEARLDLLSAEQERFEQERRVIELYDAMERSRDQFVPGDVETLIYQQQWILRMEMVRRGAEEQLFERECEVSRRREIVVEKAKDARVIERVAEVREEADAVESRQRLGKILDELGVQAWWGRSE